MEKKQRQILFLWILVVVLVIMNYSFIDQLLIDSFNNGDFEMVFVERVIDGDTIAISGYFPSVSYLRIPSIFGGDYDAEGRVLEVEYIDSWNPE